MFQKPRHGQKFKENKPGWRRFYGEDCLEVNDVLITKSFSRKQLVGYSVTCRVIKEGLCCSGLWGSEVLKVVTDVSEQPITSI